MTTREELLALINIDPQVCFGKRCIRGHCIWISLILDLLAGGASIEEILADNRSLEEADVRAYLAYGAIGHGALTTNQGCPPTPREPNAPSEYPQASR